MLLCSIDTSIYLVNLLCYVFAKLIHLTLYSLIDLFLNFYKKLINILIWHFTGWLTAELFRNAFKFFIDHANNIVVKPTIWAARHW